MIVLMFDLALVKYINAKALGIDILLRKSYVRMNDQQEYLHDM
jgi:hypothetical protein